MTKNELLRALDRAHAEWQEGKQAIARTASTDSGRDDGRTHEEWVTAHGRRTATLCALLNEAYDARDDVTDDELADAVSMSPRELRAVHDEICSPPPSTT
jgi:hypothetical protein